jgi:hypothetical protein
MPVAPILNTSRHGSIEQPAFLRVGKRGASQQKRGSGKGLNGFSQGNLRAHANTKHVQQLVSNFGKI